MRLRLFRFPKSFACDSRSPVMWIPLMRRRLALVTALFVIGVLMVAIPTGLRFGLLSPELSPPAATFSLSHRKLLQTNETVAVAGGGGGKVVAEPKRLWGEKCSKSDIVISQGPTPPLPGGIPTYTVEISNTSPTGCDIGHIHLSCGWFSSAGLTNSHIFKRIHFDDCLVNNGKPLQSGRSVSFQYANSFSYPLSVKWVECQD